MQPFLKGMPKRLAILDLGLFKVHEDGREIGICAYVIQTTEDETILIDSGFPAKYAEDAKAATLEDKLEVFGEVLSLTPQNLLPAQLKLLGLELSDIDLMVQSHTHIDHVGYMDAFPTTPILIAKAERALSKPLYWSGNQIMEWPDAEYVLVEDDMLIGPGFEVLFVPGHAPGQLAFSLHLPNEGAMLLTSDAISRADELDTKFKGAWDPALAVQNAQRLMQRATRDRATLIFGHSPGQWPDLRKAPEWYD